MNSEALFQRALRFLPGGVNSPVRAFHHVGRSPVFFSRAEGAHLFDVNGREYVDFCMGFGPHLFGHSPKPVVDAVKAQAELGMTFGACHPAEVEFVERLLRSYPFLHKARLVNSGTEALMTAVRVARGFTGRSKIVKFDGCYHGHADGFLVKAGSGAADLPDASSAGVPAGCVADTRVVSWPMDSQGFAQLEQALDRSAAAIVLEAVPANYGLWVPPLGTVQRVCDAARKAGALVIVDEVITGFRLGPSGACALFDIQPDIVTLGKVIGGGLPLAAVLGREGVLDVLAPVGPVYQAGTLSGNPLAVAAGLAVLKQIDLDSPYAELENRTRWFVTALKEILDGAGFQVRIPQVGSMFWIQFGREANAFPPELGSDSLESFRNFFSGALEDGIYFPPSPFEVCFLSTQHTPDLLEGVLERICSRV